jgi:hypothetical protein
MGYRLREEFWEKAMVMKLQKLGYFGFIKMNIQLFMHPHTSKILAPEEFLKK